MIRPGDRAPQFRLATLDGGEAGLPEIVSGAPALAAFFKVSCPVCQLMFPHLERIWASGALPVWGVSQNPAADTLQFNREYGVTFPTLLDPERRFPASNAFGISTVPTIFLIERDGTVSRVVEGWVRKEVQSLGAMAGVNPFREGVNVPEWKAG